MKKDAKYLSLAQKSAEMASKLAASPIRELTEEEMVIVAGGKMA